MLNRSHPNFNPSLIISHSLISILSSSFTPQQPASHQHRRLPYLSNTPLITAFPHRTKPPSPPLSHSQRNPHLHCFHPNATKPPSRDLLIGFISLSREIHTSISFSHSRFTQLWLKDFDSQLILLCDFIRRGIQP